MLGQKGSANPLDIIAALVAVAGRAARVAPAQVVPVAVDPVAAVSRPSR